MLSESMLLYLLFELGVWSFVIPLLIMATLLAKSRADP